MAVIYDSSGQSVSASTATATAIGLNGLLVRMAAIDSTTVTGNAAAAGDNTIMTSNALGIYVYAYSLSLAMTGSTSMQLGRFLNGSTIAAWQVRLQSSGGSTVGYLGQVSCLAVSPPGYLFRTSAGNPLVLNVTSSNLSYAVAAWRQ